MYSTRKLTLFIIIMQLSLAFEHSAHCDSLDITPSLYNFNYREYGQAGQLLDEENGIMPGLKLGLNIDRAGNKIETQVALYSSMIDYHGQTQSGTPHETDTDTELLTLGIRLYPQLLHFPPARGFIGIRYWHWDRDIITRNNVQGLHEIYRWYELEAGLKFEYAITEQSWYWLDLSGLYIINPNMDILLPSDRLTLNLESRPGARLRAGRNWHRNENMDISLGLFAEYWEFGRSNTVFTSDFYGSPALITEPRSESFHYGLELSFIYRF